MENRKRINFFYLLFILPFVLTFLSWRYFPSFSSWVIENIIGYSSAISQENYLWITIIRFFYSWYTFIAIGLAGMWAVAAFLSRKKQFNNKQSFYPMVSFIVPAFNQDENIIVCINSLFKSAAKYQGSAEILVIDDGSRDFTYEIAWSTINKNHSKYPRILGKVIRHSSNLGKIECLKTGVNRALGGLIAIVDSDSEWTIDTLSRLVDYKLSNGKKAVTGYTHPNGKTAKGKFLVTLQCLEYSQGLGVGRSAQGLGDSVIVISGAIGIYDSALLRTILSECNVRSVTEDLEITLEMHKKGAKIGYFSYVQSSTVAPANLKNLWHQRLRWYTGWLHNTLSIHKDLIKKLSWVSSLLWYCYFFEFLGAFIDISSLVLFPIIFWFAPDPILFVYNLLLFIPYGLIIGIISQAIAIHFSYGESKNKLLIYTPFYPILRIVNIFARCKSIFNYITGNNGKWYKK